MRKKIFTFLLALAASVGMSWADVIPCTAADLGKVLCTDGSIYATVSEASAASKTAAAVIAYVDTENAKALALALADDGGEMEWATAKTTAAAHTPAVSGGTWTLASKDDWDNMINAAGGYEALRDGFSGVGGTNMNEDKYWSSTPENAYAWCYYFDDGMWVDGYVDNPCRVRACLAFDIPAEPQVATSNTLQLHVNDALMGSVALQNPSSNIFDFGDGTYAVPEGAEVTLIATPNDGYQLKSISGVYEAQGPLSETINATSETVNGNKFQAQATSRNLYGWRVYNPGTANTLTVSSKDGATLIEKIEFTSTYGNSRTNDMLSVSAGTLSFNGTPATKVTINDINATSVTISGSGNNAGKTWCISSVKIYYTGTIEKELEISDTENTNVKTFTMVDSEVTISAEFEPAPAPTNPEIKLNADFGGPDNWADTEAFTDNGDGTASWSISTLTAGSWYHFGVKVDGTWTSDNAAFDRENPSRVVSGTGEAMWFQADVAGEYTFTWEYATNTLTIGYPEIHTYTAVGQNLAVFGNSWDPSITDNDLVLQEDGSYKWEKENVSFTGAITIQYRVCEDHAWGVAYPATSEQPASFEIPGLGDYKITITYNPVGNVISASAEKIDKPTIQLNGNFSGEWADTEAFEVVEQPMDSYAKLTKLLEPGTYEFGVKVNSEWRANGSAYTRDNYSYIIEEGHTGNLTINVDVKGYYSFFWYYDNNRLTIDYSRVCGMYWKDVTAGNFEVTLGQEDEVTLPKVWATSMAFVYNIANGSDQVRLGSTDETVATIAYTLSLDGLGTLTFHNAGECDIYVVHDMTNLYCYDSCAFHLTVHPAPTPQPAEDVNIIPNVDPDHAGVYYSTFFDSANKYALPAGVEAYVATLDGAKLLLSKIADAGQTIPANNAVILKSSVTPFTLSISDAEAVPVNAINHLQGTDVSIATPGNCYVLAGNDGVGFYHYTATMLNPHKAYVIYSGSNQAPKRMPFIFDAATGVDQVPSDQVQSTKVIENGVLYIIKNGVKYNAQGQVVK